MNPHVEKILTEISENKSDGAGALALRGLDALEAAAQSLPARPSAALAKVSKLAAKIADLRPSMGAIGSQAVMLVARFANTIPLERTASIALLKAISKEREMLGHANATISSIALKEIGKGGVYVSCSWSMAAMRALVALKADRIYIGAGYPMQDGLRASGWLSARGCNVEVIPDGALSTVVKDADAVVVGADQILADGTVINRSSTFLLALAANYYKVPFWVLCQRIKLSGFSDVEIEESSESLGNVPQDVTVKSPVFDKTPASLITGIITETGKITALEAGEIGIVISSLRDKFFD